MICVEDVHKCFGDVEALKGVTLTAPNGRITGLLGPNGAGKTTTLRIVYALLRPDRGTVSVDGYDPTSRPQEVRRRIGVLPEGDGGGYTRV